MSDASDGKIKKRTWLCLLLVSSFLRPVGNNGRTSHNCSFRGSSAQCFTWGATMKDKGAADVDINHSYSFPVVYSRARGARLQGPRWQSMDWCKVKYLNNYWLYPDVKIFNLHYIFVYEQTPVDLMTPPYSLRGTWECSALIAMLH